MLKRKIIIALSILVPLCSFADDEWKNEIYSEKNAYSYSSNVVSGSKNRLEYKCSVLKLEDNRFAKIDYLNMDFDLEIDKDILNYQEEYDVNLIFSSGREYPQRLPLKVGFNNVDRFTYYFNQKENVSILDSLLKGNYIKIEVVDDNNEMMMYRFYLKGSKKSILKSKGECDLLFKTFK